jgi:hypothetical protein
MAEDAVYRCPICNKPFDTADDLASFAIAAHEKDHHADRNSPRSLIRLDDSDVWRCMLCDHEYGRHEEAAKLAAISHVRKAHGSLPASSAPATTRGGRSGAQVPRPGLGGKADAVIGLIGDGLDAAGNRIGGVAGAALEFLGNLLD